MTAVTEVDMIVNSWPLTYFSTEDVEEPVTPSHLITGRRLMSLPDGSYNRDTDDSAGTTQWPHQANDISTMSWSIFGDDGKGNTF